jgi:uracil-DNA glycosylase
LIQVSVENSFESWRKAARQLLHAEIAPEEIFWANNGQNGLFEEFSHNAPSNKFRVSSEFLELAQTVACHRDERKWSLLYRILFRLAGENRHLLEIESDDDVRRALLMARAVNRDVHKFHAFVRFRRVEFETREVFVAWHEPHHLTTERAAPFFVRRFGAMRFSILTPDLCAHWDLENLSFTNGVSSEIAPKADEIETFWLAYYSSVFNPYRLKVKAMKAELPVRHWKTLPETRLIPQLIRRAKTKTNK